MGSSAAIVQNGGNPRWRHAKKGFGRGWLLLRKRRAALVALVRDAGEHLDGTGFLPKPRQALSRQRPHAQDYRVRTELLVDLGERSGRVFGNERDDLHSRGSKLRVRL